jgi:hypothetical protein
LCSPSHARKSPLEHRSPQQVPVFAGGLKHLTATIDDEYDTKLGGLNIRNVPEGYGGTFLEEGGEIASPELNRVSGTVEFTGGGDHHPAHQ